jgi:lipopolysaccharide export system protein LptC
MDAAANWTARQRRALPGGWRDAMVATLRWLLPLLALAILAAIVVWPMAHSQEFSFVLAKDKVALSPDRLRIDNAVYRGETADGRPFEIRAGDAVQRSSAEPVVELTRLAALLDEPQGPATVTAPSGRYEMDRDLLLVRGPVEVKSATGYSLDTGDVAVDLNARTAATDRPVSGRLPIGTFSAESLRADVGGRVVVLEGRARLHIVPAKG